MGAILTVLIPPIIAWVILGVMLSDNTMTKKWEVKNDVRF